MTIKSLLLSMMALLAVSTMTLSLTSCGDDDDDGKGGDDEMWSWW